MASIRVLAEGAVAAPADRVYAYLADYRQHHPHFLPPAFHDFVVEQGGIGAGTIIRFRLRLGGRTTAHRQRVDEPEPGRVLTETDLGTGSVTTFTVVPQGGTSRARIESVWQSGGLRGLVERMLAPPMLRRLYADELARLDRYARRQAGS